jgi:hypothetical protein
LAPIEAEAVIEAPRLPLSPIVGREQYGTELNTIKDDICAELAVKTVAIVLKVVRVIWKTLWALDICIASVVAAKLEVCVMLEVTVWLKCDALVTSWADDSDELVSACSIVLSFTSNVDIMGGEVSEDSGSEAIPSEFGTGVVAGLVYSAEADGVSSKLLVHSADMFVYSTARIGDG